MRKSIKNITRKICSAAIIVVVSITAALPAFAYIASNPGNYDYFYYKFWNFGGSASYNEVKQASINSQGGISPGNDVRMQIINKKLKLNSEIKINVFQTMPSNLSPIANVTLKEKLMKKTGLFTWTPVTFEGNITEHKISDITYISRNTQVQSFYSIPIKTSEAMQTGDYQIDLTSTLISDRYANYVKLLYYSGIDKTS